MQITIVQNSEPLILQWIKITDFDAGVSPFQHAKLQLEGFSIGPWILSQDREETAARCPLPLEEEVRAIANLAAKETSVDDVSRCCYRVLRLARGFGEAFLIVQQSSCSHPTSHTLTNLIGQIE